MQNGGVYIGNDGPLCTSRQLDTCMLHHRRRLEGGLVHSNAHGDSTTLSLWEEVPIVPSMLM